MNVIKYNVNSGDVCQIGRQYEYGKTQVVFEGYQVIDSANEIYFKFVGRTEESKYLIPIVNMTLDITQQLTKHVGQFSCQLEEMNTEGTLVSQSPVFYVAVKRSIKVGADYEVQDPRLETIYQKYNEMYNIISQTNETSLANESQRQAEWLTLKQEVSDAINSFNADIAIGEFRTLVQTETDNFNTNAETKFNAYNQNDSQKTNTYNTNATEKLNAYNTNADNRVLEFNAQTGQIQTDISELKSDLNAITKEKSDVIDFDSEEIGTAYNIDNTGGVSWSGANSFIKQVNEWDNYKISTTIIKSNKYYAVLCYTDTTFVSGICQGSSSENIVLTDYDFVIPSGINKIIVTAPANVTPTLKSIEKTVDIQTFPNNYVDFDGTTLKIKVRYNNLEDIVVQMQKRGNNNLFDFDRLFTVAKSEELNGDFTELRSILLSNTDCFSPHQVRARENIDGDSTAYFLTGGNHNHENIPTAYCDNLHVFVDESEVSTFSGVCNSIRVTWENHIQGHNTWKADGTGRSVLDELIELRIVGSVFDVVIKQIPTENIYQSVYYGIQSINTPYTTVRFVGGTNRISIPINSSANSGSHNCRRTIAINPTTGDCLETKVLDEDLGTFDYTGTTYSAFTANSKLYYAVMRDQTVTMNEGELWCLFGRYRFYSDKV